MIFIKSCVLTSCVLGLWWYVLLFSFHCFIVFFVFYDSSDLVLWRFDMIFKNLYLRKKSCFLTSCFLTFLLKMRNKLNHALSHHQMVVNKNSSEFFCQKYQLWEKILLMLCTIVQESGLNLIFEQNAIERESWVFSKSYVMLLCLRRRISHEYSHDGEIPP